MTQESGSHVSAYSGKIVTGTADPVDPHTGQEYYHTGHDVRYRKFSTAWLGHKYETTTSTSSSTSSSTSTSTSTSTSITTTSTSTTQTTTSTSTTTTL